jgi:hypothetical protein
VTRHQQQCQPNQLTLNFEQAAFAEQPTSQQPMSAEHAAIIHAHLAPPVFPPIKTPGPERPSQWAWDFIDVFPTPLTEAVEAGVFGYEEDPTSEQIESIHIERANELLAILDNVASCESAKVTGVSPSTGKRPRTAATQRRLAEQLEQEPARLHAKFTDLFEAYAEGFGEQAAKQFENWVRHIHRNGLQRPAIPSQEIDLPVPQPLTSAVNGGVFGTDDNGDPIEPSEEEVHEISLQHGERLAEIFEELDSVNERLATKPGNRDELVRHKERLTCQVQGMLALYAEDFGETAARHLQSWAQAMAGRDEFRTVRPSAASAPKYGPGHPWHYLARGDGQNPTPVEEIPSSECDGNFAGKLPANAGKRREKLAQLLSDQTRQLEEDKARYNDIVARGAAALSEYDRTIAYGGDHELAVASSISLKFNHLSNGLGRVQWLKARLGLGEPPAV